MSAPDILWVLLALLLLAAIAVWWWRRHRPAPRSGGNVTDAMWWLWEQLQALEPTSQLGGIYANKPGYHNARQNLPGYDYSVTDDPPDQGGPGWAAAAIDWTFPNAQRGDYSTIARYTKRLFASAQDPADPRLNEWREFYGQADDDSYVEGWDIRYGCAATSDSSHLWHIHLSENRDQTESYDNKKALLSVLKGETVDEWTDEYVLQNGEGAVLLNCPYDTSRQDLLYIGPHFEVWHRWWTKGGMLTGWEKAGSSENIGGVIVPGTLTACWLPDASAITLCGLGQPDEPGVPAGCGQYWGYSLGRNGVKSGWGSLVGCYGMYPPGYQPPLTVL